MLVKCLAQKLQENDMLYIINCTENLNKKIRVSTSFKFPFD